MEKSESIAELSAALSKAQGELNGAEKNSVNPFFKQSYANLESVWDACRAQLAKHNIAITQIPENEGNSVIVETVMSHSSGQWISGKLRMVPEKQTPQAIGVCISYARRYALAAFVGIYQEDDDAEATKTTAKSPNPAIAPRQPAAQGVSTYRPSEAQLKRLFAITKQHGWSQEQLKGYMLTMFNIESTKDLNRSNYDLVCKVVETKSFDQAMAEVIPNGQKDSEPLFDESENFENFQ